MKDSMLQGNINKYDRQGVNISVKMLILESDGQFIEGKFDGKHIEESVYQWNQS